MAIAATLKTSAYDNVDRTSYTTASVAPSANVWLVIDICNRVTGTCEPVVPTGIGLTWVLETAQASVNDSARVTRYYAWTGSSPASGVITIAIQNGQTASGCGWIVYEISGADSADPFYNTASEGPPGTTSVDYVFGGTALTFDDPDDRPIIVAHHSANEASTPESGYTEIGDINGASPTFGLATAYHATVQDTVPSYSWTTASGTRAAIVSVIRAAGALHYNLTAIAVSATQINLDWDSVPGADSYDIERDGVVIVTGQVTTAYSDTGLSPGTLYTYRVRGVANA